MEEMRTDCQQEIESFLRAKIEEVVNDRDAVQQQNEKLRITIVHLQNTLASTNCHMEKLQSDLSTMQRQLLGGECTVKPSESITNKPMQSDDEASPRNVILKMKEELVTLGKRYETERASRQLAELKFEQMKRKYEFEKRISDLTASEMRSQLDLSSQSMAKLEELLRSIETEEKFPTDHTLSLPEVEHERIQDKHENLRDIFKTASNRNVNCKWSSDSEKHLGQNSSTHVNDRHIEADVLKSSSGGSDSGEVTTNEHFVYESNPYENKVTYVSRNNLYSGSSRPIGPVVPSSRSGSAGDCGVGSDYFEDLFRKTSAEPELKEGNSNRKIRPFSSSYQDYRIATAGATGNIRIVEVDKNGGYVRLINEDHQDVPIGNYTIRQMVGGHPVALFRFPPHTTFHGLNSVTVWSRLCDQCFHLPPSDFCWLENQKWGTGSQCTTILCTPGGQAIAWHKPPHRFTRDVSLDQRTVGRQKDSDLSTVKDEEKSVNGEDEKTEKQESSSLHRDKLTSILSMKKASSFTSGEMKQRREEPPGKDTDNLLRDVRVQQMGDEFPLFGECHSGTRLKLLAKTRTVKFSSTTKEATGKIPRCFSAPQRQPLSPHKDVFSKVRVRYNAGLSNTREI